MLEAKLRAEHKVAEEIGALPPELKRYAGQFDTVPVGIKPHETLLAMQQEFKDFGDLCFRLGFEVLHNKTAPLPHLRQSRLHLQSTSATPREDALRPFRRGRADLPNFSAHARARLQQTQASERNLAPP